MKIDAENTYNPDNVHQLGLDWDEYEEAMAEYNEQQVSDNDLRYEDDYVQRTIMQWNPEAPNVNHVDHWMD